MLLRKYEMATTFDSFLQGAEANAELWRSTYDRAHVPDDLLERAQALPARRRLLVLLEDWCLDAVSIVPYVVRLAEASPMLEVRVLARDQNLDLMDAYLTNGARSIPMVIALDDEGREIGWWGPRPAELQAWFVAEGRALEPSERYAWMRRWYARDRGRATIAEILDVVERESAHAVT